MTDLTKTIEPKSDQLNADDLITGPMTLTIKSVNLVSGEQPIAIGYEGDNGKPYKPCKSMRRVLITVWGKDGNQYVGRSIVVYRDESVKFGGDAVGGIRISHMSHIDEPKTIALTVTRGKRKPYTITPLVIESNRDLVGDGMNESKKGTDALKTFWESLSAEQRKQLKDKIGEWKKIAAESDGQK